MLLSSRRVCHGPCSVLCLLTVPSPFAWAVRSFSSSLEEVLSSFVPPEPPFKQNVAFHITWEEWEEPSGLDSLTFWVCPRPEQQRKSTKCENSGSHLHHTPSKRWSSLPLAKRFKEGRSPPPPPRSHSAPRTATCTPSFCYSTRCSTNLQVSEACELHSFLPLCVVPKNSVRNLFGREEVQGRPSAPSLRRWGCLSCTRLITSCRAARPTVTSFSCTPWAVRPKVTSFFPRSLKL